MEEQSPTNEVPTGEVILSTPAVEIGTELLRECVATKQWELSPNGKRWSSVKLANKLGISGTVIRAIWREGRKP